MSAPRSTEELGMVVEELVRSYVAEVQAAVVAGAKRGMGNTGVASFSSKRPRGGTSRDKAGPRRPSGKRTPEVLERLATRLYEKVCATPGGTMSQFAGELGVSIAEMQHPRSMLKAHKRIRTTGVRSATRYYRVP
jgi:hypothetical protein